MYITYIIEMFICQGLTYSLHLFNKLDFTLTHLYVKNLYFSLDCNFILLVIVR